MRAELRQGEVPPQAFDTCEAALVFDRLPKRLIDDSHLGRGRCFAEQYAREPEEIARELRAARMQDEGSAHPEDSSEKAGFEDDIVSRRSLTGSRGRGCGEAGCRPVVPGECERGEVDFMRKLEETDQCSGSGIE